jgi:hypothetical protein
MIFALFMAIKRRASRPDRFAGSSLEAAVMHFLSRIDRFSRLVLCRPLRRYQLEPALAILDSIFNGRGLTFAVMMSRQAGKNELSGQLEAYLLNLYQRAGGQIVKASPTFKPQTVNSILRLCDRLRNDWNDGRWRRREGYMVELGEARALFFSAGPGAQVVGATASILLEGDEAQDIAEEKWYKDFRPMAASTNATTVLWGTAWTDDTLLAKAIQDLGREEARDGRRRVFLYDADAVGAEVPAYAAFVRNEVARLGRDHPLIKTQYFLETIAGDARMFTPARVALMRGDHERRHEPVPGRRYALLIDVAGEDEQPGDPLERLTLENPRRDATALTVVDVEHPASSGAELPGSGARAAGTGTSGRGASGSALGPALDTAPQTLPTYRTIDRRLWLGVRHSALYAQILALARHWSAVWVVVDATGVGAGLASFLTTALGDGVPAKGRGRVIPVVFSPKVKSDLGWDFLAIVETGRYRDYVDDGESDTRQFWYEVAHCDRQVRIGDAKSISWGVWESPAYDGLIARGHDDLLISAALTAVLDRQGWPGTGPSATVPQADVLADIDGAEW